MGLLNSFNKKDDGQKLYEQAQSFFEEGKIREGYVFMEKAAEAGYPEAQFQLGCSIIELKYNKPIEDGLMWLNKAAEQNHIFAINNLAMCYQMGEGVNVDYAKALSLLEKAASLGDMMAYYNIGQVYIFGLGVQKDVLKGLTFMQKAAESDTEGCEHAQYFLGQVSERGIEEEGISPDLNKAIKWYMMAAEHEDREAIKALQRLKVIDGDFDDEYIAKRFMGMWLHYDISYADEIIGRNLKYSAYLAPKDVDYKVLIFRDHDYEFFINELRTSLETILNSGGKLRCRLRKEEQFYCDTIQNGQMISYELLIDSNKIYAINKLVIEG